MCSVCVADECSRPLDLEESRTIVTERRKVDLAMTLFSLEVNIIANRNNKALGGGGGGNGLGTRLPSSTYHPSRANSWSIIKGYSPPGTSIVMLFPLSSIWSNLVIFLPSGVFSLQ